MDVVVQEFLANQRRISGKPVGVSFSSSTVVAGNQHRAGSGIYNCSNGQQLRLPLGIFHCVRWAAYLSIKLAMKPRLLERSQKKPAVFSLLHVHAFLRYHLPVKAVTQAHAMRTLVPHGSWCCALCGLAPPPPPP